MTYCIINCTASNKEEAIKISKYLVQNKLIACCNIVSSVTSVYSWKDQINEDNEVLMIMKTKTSLYKKVEKEIKNLHSYETPEIICIPVTDGSLDYLAWVKEQTI